MATRTQTSASTHNGVAPEKLISLPSLSCALSSLPQARDMGSVSLHPTMYAQRAAESEAKLKKVLSKTASTFTPLAQAPPAYMIPPPRETNSPGSYASSPPLMMRKPQRPPHH